MRDQLLGHLNDFCEHKHSPSQSSPPLYFQLFSLSLFVFDFLDLPDVMPEVGDACSLIWCFLTLNLPLQKRSSVHKNALVALSNDLSPAEYSLEKSIFNGNKKTTTLSKWHFSCGYMINEAIQTNLPSWSWVLKKPLRSPSNSLQESIQVFCEGTCTMRLIRFSAQGLGKNVPVNVNTLLAEWSIFCLQLQFIYLRFYH